MAARYCFRSSPLNYFPLFRSCISAYVSILPPCLFRNKIVFTIPQFPDLCDPDYRWCFFLALGGVPDKIKTAFSSPSQP